MRSVPPEPIPYDMRINKEINTKGINLNELEAMAKGFIETDDLLTKEGEMTSKLSYTIKALNSQLHDEVAKGRVTNSQACHFSVLVNSSNLCLLNFKLDFN